MLCSSVVWSKTSDNDETCTDMNTEINEGHIQHPRGMETALVALDGITLFSLLVEKNETCFPVTIGRVGNYR